MKISAVGFGSWEAGGGTTWGPNQDDAEVVAAMRSAVANGVDWIDTAEVYGGGGGSERMVGAAVRELPDVKICTKIAPEPDDSKFTEAGVRAALQESLTRLGRDFADIYLLHWPAAGHPLDDTLATLGKLKDEGLIGAYGLSNYPLDGVEAALAGPGIDFLQVQGSLLYRDELEVYGEKCRRNGVGLMVYGPLAFGLLTGVITERTDLRDWRGGEVMSHDFFCAENYPRFFAPEARARHLKIVDALKERAVDWGMTLPELSIAWLLAQPAVTSVIVGTRSPGHAVDNARAAMIELSADNLREIAEILNDTMSEHRH